MKEYFLTRDEFYNIPQDNRDGKYIVENWGTFYLVNGRYHREDGPALDYIDGEKCWAFDGDYHRLDGPAREGHNANDEYYVYHIRYSSKEEYEIAAYLYKNNLENYQ